MREKRDMPKTEQLQFPQSQTSRPNKNTLAGGGSLRLPTTAKVFFVGCLTGGDERTLIEARIKNDASDKRPGSGQNVSFDFSSGCGTPGPA